MAAELMNMVFSPMAAVAIQLHVAICVKASAALGMQVQTEVYVMHKVHHPNVLSYEAWYETRNNFWLILELAAGTLAQVADQDGRLSSQAVQVRTLLSCGLSACPSPSHPKTVNGVNCAQRLPGKQCVIVSFHLFQFELD